MARKKIDLKKGQTFILIGNNTTTPVIINRINIPDDTEIYDGFEITVALEKPSVAPVGEAGNQVILSWVKEGVVTSNLILRTEGNNADSLHIQQSIYGPNYYEGVGTYANNCLCVVRFVYSRFYEKWIEVSRQYTSFS